MRRVPDVVPRQALPIVLVGLPGAGKTSVSRELARLTGMPSIDTDSEVRRHTRLSIPEIFAQRGEAGFREVEHRAIAHTLQIAHGIVALGGGAVLHRGTRELLRSHTVVHLLVEPDEAVRRVTGGEDRPLLGNDPDAKMREFHAQRAALYRDVTTVAVETTGRAPAEIAEEIVEKIRQGIGRVSQVKVPGNRPYSVVLGHGLNGRIAHLVGGTARRVLLVHAPALADRAEVLAAKLTRSRHTHHDVKVIRHVLPAGEATKSLTVTGQLWDVMGAEQLGRQDVVVALGGGATTDQGGFAAATWLRGIDVVQVPTTVLAMVDAAVGGKTGINTSAGKNLVGAFHPPRGVICDLDSLETLPRPDRRAGLAEVLKCGLIADPVILERVAQDPQALVDGPVVAMREIMERAIEVKAKIVGKDLRESGLRELLNYGHTLAHAIERHSDYQWRHGDAVAVGCVFAAAVAEELGVAAAGMLDQHREIFASVGLPVTYPREAFADLREIMAQDKKVRDRSLRFVLLRCLAKPRVLVVRDEAALQRAYAAVAE